MIFKTTEYSEIISSATSDLAATLVDEWNTVYDKLLASTTEYANYIEDRLDNLEPFKTVKNKDWVSTAFSRLTAQPFFFNQEVYPKDYVEAGEASFARRYNMETVEPISIAADIVKHGHFTIRQTYTDNGRYERKSRLEVEIVLTTKELGFLSKDVLGATAKEVGEVFVEWIVNEFWETDQINPVYDTSLPLVYKSKYNGPVVLKDGTLFYLYKNLKDTDKRAEYQRLVSESGGKKLPNYLICIDIQNGVLFQTNSSGESVVIDLKGMNKPSEELVAKLFNSTCAQVISSGRAGSLFSTLNLSRLLSEEDLLFWSTNSENALVDTEDLLPALLKLKEVYEGHKHNVLPSTYLKCIGLIQLLLENAKTAKATVAKVSAKREKFDTASTEDLPKVANLREDLVYLPHQAACLTKLDVAEDTAILDVGTGGGKSVLLIADALNILAKTGGKNPLIVVPNSIVGQWIGQIQFFTNNSVNAVPLTTETINNWGEEGLEELIASAPKNTIFLTTYSFLTNGAEDLGHDYKFPRVEWILDRLNPTYVALDESHFCKNPEALRTKAVLKLKDIPYRRLATGTLISNTPNDLIGQIAFLDPKIVGDSEEFAARYGAYQDGRGRVLEWKPNAADLIRKDLRENSYYIVAREKDWAGSLPKITYNRELVKLTVNQQKMYKVIVEEVLSEIMDDPNLRQQWLDFINSGNDEESSMSAVLLGKLAKLEQFLTAPDRSEFIKYVSGDDAISPKLAKIDELIADSISKGYKCIVAVHYKHSARHLLEHSKYKSVGIYYDASHRDNLSKFQNQDNIKVMFAVITSITEGVNLQMANRIVIADVDWTSGKLKQLIARIYRPHIKIDGGKVKNLNKNKTVYIDTVLAENSADTLKYLFQTYKKIFNSNVMENCPVEIPGRPTINDNTLTASFAELGGERTLGLDDQYNNWFNQGVEEMRGRNGEPVPVKLRKPLDTKLIDTPWVVGMPLSTEGDEISLSDFMEDNGLDLEDARNSKKELVGKFVKGEFGTGKITGVYKNSVRIKDADGETYTTSIAKVVVVPERTKVDRKKVEEEAEQLTSDNAVELLIINYNDLPTLVADFDDPDSKTLKAFKFRYQGPYKYFPIQNARQGLRKLDAIEKKYKIVGRPKLEEIIDDVQDSSYEYEVTDLKNFFKLKHVKAKPGTVKLYALIEDGAPYIVYDIATHPGVSLPGFKTAEGYYYRSTNNNGVLKTILQQIIKSLKVTNLKELKVMARELKIKL